MAVTKLRADAPPFLLPSSLEFPTPPSPQCMTVSHFHPAAGSPCFHVVPSYPVAFFLAPPLGPICGFHPPPHPATMPAVSFLATVPCKGSATFVRKVAARPATRRPKSRAAVLRKTEPSPPPAEPVPLISKDVPSPPPPAPLRLELLPHGSAPHKLCRGKPQEQAAVSAIASAAEPVKPGQELAPAPAAGPRYGRRMAPPRSLLVQQQFAGRGRSKVVGVGQVKVPVEHACKPPARCPSPAFTTKPPAPVPAPEWGKRRVTSVMIRNIPNRLKPDEMMQLLDEHCARANRKRKKLVPAAYDFLYLPMDFSKCSNMGYAFVNLTTPEAARGLHYALHGARWTVHATKKVIDICAACIQGRDALVTHFSGSTFPCHTDEYLPAAFSPPRDGAAGLSSAPKYVGNRVGIPAPPQPVAVAPAPQRAGMEASGRGRRRRG